MFRLILKMIGLFKEYLSTYKATNYIFDPLSLVAIHDNRVSIRANQDIQLNEKNMIPLHVQYQTSHNFDHTIITNMCQSANPQIIISETQISNNFDVTIITQVENNVLIKKNEIISYFIYHKKKPLMLMRKSRENHKRFVTFIDKIICVVGMIIIWKLLY